MAVSEIDKYLKDNKSLVDNALQRYFPDTNPFFAVMRYSLQGGKRIRPILAITSFRCCGGEDIEVILPTACGLELIHTYSLIHDDLPAMDDDDMRRGRLTCHKAFDEALAILTGDAPPTSPPSRAEAANIRAVLFR